VDAEGHPSDDRFRVGLEIRKDSVALIVNVETEIVLSIDIGVEVGGVIAPELLDLGRGISNGPGVRREVEVGKAVVVALAAHPQRIQVVVVPTPFAVSGQFQKL
jgi:hypothetical protein